MSLCDTLAWELGDPGLNPGSASISLLRNPGQGLSLPGLSLLSAMWKGLNQSRPISFQFCLWTALESGSVLGPPVFPGFKLSEPGLAEFPPLLRNLHAIPQLKGSASKLKAQVSLPCLPSWATPAPTGAVGGPWPSAVGGRASFVSCLKYNPSFAKNPKSALWERVWREPGTSRALGSSELCGPHSLLLKHGVEGLALERGCALIKTPAVVSTVASGDSWGCGSAVVQR